MPLLKSLFGSKETDRELYEKACAYGKEKRYDLAYDIFYELAENGNVYAAANLANYYRFGKGVPKDDYQVFYWLNRASANLEVPRGVGFDLAECYANGFGTKRNPIQAIKWYEREIKTENPKEKERCLYRAGCLRQEIGNEEKAFFWFRKLCSEAENDTKYRDGFLRLAECYEKGKGVSRDLEQAIRWYRRYLEIKDNPKVVIRVATLMDRRGQQEEAIAVLEPLAGSGNEDAVRLLEQYKKLHEESMKEDSNPELAAFKARITSSIAISPEDLEKAEKAREAQRVLERKKQEVEAMSKVTISQPKAKDTKTNIPAFLKGNTSSFKPVYIEDDPAAVILSALPEIENDVVEETEKTQNTISIDQEESYEGKDLIDSDSKEKSEVTEKIPDSDENMAQTGIDELELAESAIIEMHRLEIQNELSDAEKYPEESEAFMDETKETGEETSFGSGEESQAFRTGEKNLASDEGFSESGYSKNPETSIPAPLYEGDVLDGIPEGSGRLTCYIDENTISVYEGSFVHGLPNGMGKYWMEDSNDHHIFQMYEGEFTEGDMTGMGQYAFENGEIYAGRFRKGVLNGQGLLRLATGTQYEGNFLMGRANGYGVIKSCNGIFYEGYFSSGSANGTARIVYPDGSSYFGEVTQGQIPSEPLLIFMKLQDGITYQFEL